MPPSRLALLTLLALFAFAGNSLLCRAALAHTSIDAASFTTVRLLAGAITLWLLVVLRGGARPGSGNWLSAIALFVYAAGFSFAYVHVSAGVGALILFGAVQVSMISVGLWSGERFRWPQTVGLLLACGGLIWLMLPSLSAPPLVGALLMIGAGVAWGVYSLRGKGAGDPLQVTAGNFVRATVLAAALSVVLSLALPGQAKVDMAGIAYAVLSGALASGVGYAVWYTALPFLKATTAAVSQLSVPVIAAVGGVLFLQESLTLRLVLASVAVLGGVALVVFAKDKVGVRRAP